ncbi:replication factor A [Salinigranum rubrum]|uniref:Replication factor A n=1 Tax=Salinigranum rubrum TaxID=755307 RepID=A0A2I8VHW5_9EURY|nr:single-stranded DNA binding protein [Salinigranum rubrum]AUV80639.1 replication factor A [Salinigranum rubrum]
MGVIEDVYEDVSPDVDFEEFEAAVQEKVEQMGGLADEETAAMLVAHELEDAGGEVSGIADIEPGMDEVKFVAKVVSIGEIKTFERDGEDEDGKVVNVEVADETGRIRAALWDDAAEAAVDELEVGQVLRIAGRPKDGYNGVEVNVDRVEPDSETAVDVQVLDTYRVEDLSLGLSDVNLSGRVLATDSVRTFDRDDGSEGKVANLVLGDPTGRVRVTLWDERADLATEFAVGESVEVVDGYVRERDGDLELHVGNRGGVEPIDEDVEYVPETDPIAGLEIGQTVDVAGGVIELDEKRTFDRDDGSQGQVRNVRIKDDTGDIRVALWGDKADTEMDLGQYAVFTDVQVKEGWQDDLECSVNWRSTVSVLDERPDDAPTHDAPAAATATSGGSAEGQGSLSSFDSSAGSSSTSSSSSSSSSSASSSAGAAAATGPADDANADAPEEIEFTGTVVQAGSPVVLDDGTETYSIDTDASLRLGEEVTVRGRVRDGRIDAEDVF